MVTEKYSKNQPLPFNQTRPQKYVQYIIHVVFLKLYLDASKDMAEEYFFKIDFFCSPFVPSESQCDVKTAASGKSLQTVPRRMGYTGNIRLNGLSE